MEINSSSNFDRLPVELVLHILTYLDTETILCSLRYVCRRFYRITNVYNRYELNCQALNKWTFYRYCRIVQPENILSLILSDDDQTPGQIALFFSFFHLKQFEHLQALTLVEIDDIHLNMIAEDLSILPLKSLTIQSQTCSTWSNENLSCLSNILEQSSLKHLTLGIWCFEIYEFLWPNQCQLQYLHISNRLTYEQYSLILERCYLLEIFIINDVLWNDTNMINSNQYRQLKSLTLEDNRMDIFKLERFLLLTPALRYLKVIGMAYLHDCYRWEKILRIKLPSLDRFEFFFLSWKSVDYNLSDMQFLIRPFQTSFWVENKQWIVNCDYNPNPVEMMLYSIPICKPFFHYYDRSKVISCANVKGFQLDQTITKQISQLKVNLARIINEENSWRKTDSSLCPLFPNINSLTVDFDEKYPLNIPIPLSDLINLHQLHQLVLNLHYDTDIPAILTNLFRQTMQIDSLEIHNHCSSQNCTTTIEDICVLIPSYIKHLKMTVKNINEMKILFDRFAYLSSITFQFTSSKSIPSAKLIESILNIKKDLTYRTDDCSIRVWLNQFSNEKQTHI